MSNVDRVISWRVRVKQKLIEYKGKKCIKCGYDKKEYPRVFNFHHRDPKEKDFSISSKTIAFERMKKEVDKCDLLCVRCHAEIHDEIDNVKRFELRRFEEKIKWLVAKPCEKCRVTFQPGARRQKFCSEKCASSNRRKVERPPKDELLKMVAKNSYCAVGRLYGVSDNAIRKWVKYYENFVGVG